MFKGLFNHLFCIGAIHRTTRICHASDGKTVTFILPVTEKWVFLMSISLAVTISETGTIIFIKDEVTLVLVTRLSDLSRSHSELTAMRARSLVTVTMVFKDGHVSGI